MANEITTSQAAIYPVKKQHSLWRDPLFWLTLALSIFAVAPLLQPGYFWGANDARHHIYFLFEYDRSVQDGIWWPRWSPDFAFGYGYPFFNIYAPFSHFLAELLLRFLNFDHITAIETIFSLSIVGSAASMYVCVRSWIGRQSAVVAALVYVYIPYHLLNLYIRANLTESMAFIWLPLCFWTFRQAIIQSRLQWIIGAAVCYAGLMMTSNLVIVLFTPLLAIYILVLIWLYGTPDATADLMLPTWVRLWHRLRRSITPALAALFGLGLSAVFWLPMFLERQYVRVDQWFDGRYNYSGHFIYLFQLFSPRWDFGTSGLGPDDSIGFQLGVAPTILACLGILITWRLVGKLRWEIATIGTVAVMTICVGLPWATPLWEMPMVGTFLGFAQFPWRWFTVSAFCISLLSGLFMHPLVSTKDGVEPTHLNLSLLAVIAVILLSSYPMLYVKVEEPAEGPVSLAALMRFQRSADEMTGSTAWTRRIPYWSPMADHYINQDAAGEPVMPVTTKVDYASATSLEQHGLVVGSLAHNTVMEEIYFRTIDDIRKVTFNHFYYPGWHAYLLDGEHGEPIQELQILTETEGTLGRMQVPLPAGEGYMLLRFEDTQPRILGRTITLATLAVLALMSLAQIAFNFRRRTQRT